MFGAAGTLLNISKRAQNQGKVDYYILRLLVLCSWDIYL